MDANSEFLCIIGLSVAVLALIARKKFKKSRDQRRMWVNPYLRQRAQKGRFYKDVS